MPFPSHDQYWVDVADFLNLHLAPDEDILAPAEFEYRFINSFSYTVSHAVPASGFQWVVIHKGLLDRLAVSFVLDTVKQCRPVYTNPVFVVFSRHARLPAVQDNNDLIDFNQRLRVLMQASSTPSSPADPVTTAATAHYPTPANSDLKVSVITVCRNAAATIEKTLQQVAAQTYPNIEYIVIDGDSTDDTLAVCDRYQSAITTLVSEPDDGIYQAMNKGISLVTGDFLYFANADDYLFDPYVIQDLVAFIHDHPDCDVVYGDHEACFPNGSSSIHPSVPPEQMLDAIICFKGGCLLQPACLFRATTFEKVGGFSETYTIASDYKWFLDALQISTLKFQYFARTLVSYAHGGRSGDIRALFGEIFDIQTHSAICQELEWTQKRAQALQQDFINKYERLEEINRLAAQRDRHLLQLKQRVSSV